MKLLAAISVLVLAGVVTLLFVATAARAALEPAALPWGGARSLQPAGAVPHGVAARSSGLSGTGIIDGTVRDFAGSPLAGAQVGWFTKDWSSSGGAATDASGHYEITGVPALAGTGRVWLVPPSKLGLWYTRTNATFLDPGPTTFDVWPGRLAMKISRGGPWRGWSGCALSLFGADAQSAVESDQWIRLAPRHPVFNGFAYPLASAYTSAVFTFGNGGNWPARRTEALELSFPAAAPATVPAGQTGIATLTADERQAGRMMVTGWASAAPGATVVLRFADFPAGYPLHVTGQSMNGHEPERNYGTLSIASPAPAAVTMKVRVPRRVPLGDYYTFEAQRKGGQLWLTASVQVCSLVARRDTIQRGSAVRLSGRIPFAFDPSHYYRGTRVTLFARTSAAAQPKTWSATGWTKVMTLKATNHGAFVTPPLHPGRTTWFVVRYPSSGGHDAGSFWRGFSPVREVRVR